MVRGEGVRGGCDGGLSEAVSDYSDPDASPVRRRKLSDVFSGVLLLLFPVGDVVVVRLSLTRTLVAARHLFPDSPLWDDNDKNSSITLPTRYWYNTDTGPGTHTCSDYP